MPVRRLLLVTSLAAAPVFCGAVLGASPNAAEKVTVRTRDGVDLKGVYLPPTNGMPVLVMLHGLAAVKEEWTPLEKKLAEAGWGYLAYDARGQGESSLTKGPDGSPDGWQHIGRPGPGSQWERMIDDLGTVMSFLQKNKAIDHKNIAVAGASLGANVALNYVALTRSARALMLLSPGLNYQEIKTEDVAAKVTSTPILIVASRADRYAFVTCQELVKENPAITFWSDVREGHGVQMFDEKLLNAIMHWLESAH
jgi:pimeloyl-ACP methyl ester carboxylesterase